MIKEKLQKFKGYIDLHFHLDGSLDIDTVRKLMEINNINEQLTDEEIKLKTKVSKDCKDLNEYLSKFSFPISLLQTKEAITEAFYLVKERLKKEGLIYAEIRFSPAFFTQKSLSQEDVIKAAIKGAKKSDFKAKIILCLMRNLNYETNLETVLLAKKYLGDTVVALDLAGAEGLYPTARFESLFKKARELNIPFTIHAGEADRASSVKAALNFGAKRIGHGVNSFTDKYCLNFVQEHNITYEVCPTSNLNTKVINSVKDYPLRELINNKINVTINTDNTSVSNTNIKEEYELINDAFDLTNEEFKYLIKNSIKSAFLSTNEKEELLDVLDNKFKEIDI